MLTTMENNFCLMLSIFFRIQNIYEVRAGENSKFFVSKADFKEYVCEDVLETHILDKCQDAEIIVSKDSEEGCALSIDLKMKPSKLFRINLLTNKRHYLDENPYPTCSSEWKPRSETWEDIQNWINDLDKMQSDYLWREVLEDGPVLDPKGKVSYQRNDMSLDPKDAVKMDIDYGTSIDGELGRAKMSINGIVKMNSKHPEELLPTKGSFLFSQSQDLVTSVGVLQFDHAHMNESDYQIKHGTVSHFRNGKPEGIVRHFGKVLMNKEHVCYKPVGFKGLSFVCRYHKGRAVGPCWRFAYGGGVLYSMNDKFTGDDVAYIYPDMSLAMVGKFEDGVMISAKKTFVNRTRCVGGIMELEFIQPLESYHAFHFEKVTNT